MSRSFGVPLPNFGTDMSHYRVFSHGLILVLCIFSATFFWARGKRSGFIPTYSSLHSQHARAHTDCNLFFFPFFS